MNPKDHYKIVVFYNFFDFKNFPLISAKFHLC